MTFLQIVLCFYHRSEDRRFDFSFDAQSLIFPSCKLGNVSKKCDHSRFHGPFVSSQIIREEMEEKFNDGTFSWEDRRPHDCATLLKQFLR